MTKNKPTGWCAWHPERGMRIDTFNSSEKDCMNSLCIYQGYYKESEVGCGPTYPDEAKKDGWQIRPVLLADFEKECVVEGELVEMACAQLHTLCARINNENEGKINIETTSAYKAYRGLDALLEPTTKEAESLGEKK